MCFLGESDLLISVAFGSIAQIGTTSTQLQCQYVQNMHKVACICFIHFATRDVAVRVQRISAIADPIDIQQTFS